MEKELSLNTTPDGSTEFHQKLVRFTICKKVMNVHKRNSLYPEQMLPSRV
jgi:hypothetical protein